VDLDSWQLGLACNAVVALAYLGIVALIVVPLARSRQLRSNALGVATAAVFLTGAMHHGAYAVQLLAAPLGGADAGGRTLPAAWGWPLAGLDLLAAIAAVGYLVLRRRHGSLLQDAQLFEDLRRREQQALELNDTVLQGLVVAKLALDLDQPAKAEQALASAIDSASTIITELLGSGHHALDLVRSVPAAVSSGPDPAPAYAPAGPSPRSLR
jgi:hypothetical protein